LRLIGHGIDPLRWQPLIEKVPLFSAVEIGHHFRKRAIAAWFVIGAPMLRAIPVAHESPLSRAYSNDFLLLLSFSFHNSKTKEK
jgi:hypothetical protein